MGSQAALGGADPPSLVCPGQTLCFRVRKMMDVYKPGWCEVREDWSVYLFSPKNRWEEGAVLPRGEEMWGVASPSIRQGPRRLHLEGATEGFLGEEDCVLGLDAESIPTGAGWVGGQEVSPEGAGQCFAPNAGRWGQVWGHCLGSLQSQGRCKPFLLRTW